jgi:hypothetical protein
LASKAPDQTGALLAEVEQAGGAHETPYYARLAAVMVRTALTAGHTELAKRLAEGLAHRYPLDEYALCAARAQLAEHAGELAEASVLYADATSSWQEFGNVPERAYSLLGRGRCLLALNEPGAQEPLGEARDLFASMGYQPPLAETEALLEHTAAAPTS